MPSVRQAVQSAKENMLDFAEGKLFQAISAGNMTALIFYLKTQGVHRGYIERREVTGEAGATVKVEIVVKTETAKKLTEQVLSGIGTE